jgi:hypothetical protein
VETLETMFSQHVPRSTAVWQWKRMTPMTKPYPCMPLDLLAPAMSQRCTDRSGNQPMRAAVSRHLRVAVNRARVAKGSNYKKVIHCFSEVSP